MLHTQNAVLTLLVSQCLVHVSSSHGPSSQPCQRVPNERMLNVINQTIETDLELFLRIRCK